MKQFLAGSAFLALTLFLVQAQDDAPPPPAPDQMAPAVDQGPPPGPDQSAPGDNASFQTFYDNLSSQGTWVQTDNYGYAFQPNVTDPNWAPYSDGSWAYTDAGWTWVSDEPWGWATYHYGRWINIDGTGWVWVPGYRWAPAWVSWRFGGGYCGWAPLPPESFIGVEFGGGGFGGYHFGGDVDTAYHIGPGYYNFVPIGRMGDPNLRGAIVNRNHNFSIINRTTNITNINIGSNSGTNRFGQVRANGPSLSAVNAQSSQPVRTLRLTAAGGPGRASVQGNSLAVFAPHVNAATARQGQPATISRTLGQASFNRGDSITRPLAITTNLRPTGPTPVEIQQAHLAQAHIPASAHVATTRTPVRSVNLTAQPPVVENHPTSAVNHATTFHPQAAATGTVPRAEQNFTGQPETQTHPVNRATEYDHAPATTSSNRPENSTVVHHPSAETFHAQSTPPTSFHEERHETSHPEVEHRASAPHTEAHAEAPHPVSHPSGGGGKPKPAGKPAPADGKADDKKPNG